MSFSKTILATFVGALGALYVYDHKDYIQEKLVFNSSEQVTDELNSNLENNVLEETKNSDT